MSTAASHARLARLRLTAACVLLPLGILALGEQVLRGNAPATPLLGALSLAALLMAVTTVLLEPLTRRAERRAQADAAALAEHLDHARERADRLRTRRARMERVLDGRDSPQIVFQPFVVLSTGEVSGYEALSRFSIGSPVEWFSEAAALGMREELELKAIRRALLSLGSLPGRSPYLAVKASPCTLLSERFRALMASTDVRRVVIELSDDPSAGDSADYAALSRALSPMRARGARLAVDDVGIGRSSLLQVAMLEPDILKIDAGFTRGLVTGKAARSTVSALVGLGESLRATVVVGAVETAGLLTAARDLGVHAAQGWHLGEPQPLDRLVIPTPRSRGETTTRLRA